MDAKELELLRSMGEPMALSETPGLLRAFFYGDPGHGKTRLAADIIEAVNGNPIWITSDSGWSTVKDHPVGQRTWRIPFDSFAHLRLIAQAHTEGIEPFCNYDFLVVDTVSTAIQLMLEYLVENKPFPKEEYSREIPTRGHYRMVETGMKKTVDILNKSNLNVIYLAHIRDPTDDDKAKRRFAIRPAGPEATYRVIAQEVNLLGWLYKEKQGGQRKVQFEPTLQETAKTQISLIQEKTYNVEEIPTLIQKYLNK